MNEIGYETEERAAIREIDARTSRTDAERLAREDIRQREVELNQEGIKRRIKELQDKREKITNEMTSLRECERKKTLFDEWVRLNKKILELRKELR